MSVYWSISRKKWFSCQQQIESNQLEGNSRSPLPMIWQVKTMEYIKDADDRAKAEEEKDQKTDLV